MELIWINPSRSIAIIPNRIVEVRGHRCEFQLGVNAVGVEEHHTLPIINKASGLDETDLDVEFCSSSLLN